MLEKIINLVLIIVKKLKNFLYNSRHFNIIYFYKSYCFKASQQITNYTYLECKGILSINRQSLGLVAYSLVIYRLCKDKLAKGRLFEGERTII